MRRNALILCSATLTALALWSTAHGGEFDVRDLHSDYGVAILSPVDTGPPRDQPLVGKRLARCFFTPYYSPLTPIPVRWRTCKHWADIYTHYYPGYSACGYRGPNLFVSEGDAFSGPASACPAPSSACGLEANLAAGDYGAYTGAPRDETSLLHLGGSGPGTPGVYRSGPPDIIDVIQGCRGRP